MTLVGSRHSEAPAILRLASTNWQSAQVWPLFRNAKRMAFKMTLVRMTIARPMKARVRVFLPFWILPGSPEENIYI